MSAAHDQRAVKPFWMVQLVFDPDGGGADFAYTIGLAHRGHPELHIWARPSLGDDPGLDWKLSPRDCCGVLNELAAQLVLGDLEVGSTLRREYDGGLAVVEYRVDPPGDRQRLEAYGAPEGAAVLPVRWSLSRPPIGPALPLGDLEVRRMSKRYDELVGRLSTRDGLPKGWELPDRPSFEVGQRLGPLTPLVLARAAQMTQVDARRLNYFLIVSFDAGLAVNPTWPLVRARALGRPAGRTPALDNLDDAVGELMEAWSRQRRQRERWRSLVDDYIATAPEGLPHLPRSQADARLRDALRTAVTSCLAGELMLDIADDELRLMTAGPWEAAVSKDGRPGPAWHASDAVLDRVRAVLADLSAHQLAMIAGRHRAALGDWSGGSWGDEAYEAQVSRIMGFAVTTAATCPGAEEMVTDAVRQELVSRWIVDAVKGTGHTRYALDSWLTCLAVLLVHRAHFTAEQVRTFAARFEDLLPDLGRAVDEPI